MWIGHHKDIQKLTFQLSALHWSKLCHWICSNKGQMLEMSAFESLYGGQFTSSTQLIKPNYLLKTCRVLHNCFSVVIFSIIVEYSLLISSVVLSLTKQPDHKLPVFVVCLPVWPAELSISERPPCCPDAKTADDPCSKMVMCYMICPRHHIVCYYF